MNSIAKPNRRRKSASSSRICACTVTSSAVVGSSAISSCGRFDDRHGNQNPLPLPARKLVRIIAIPPLPPRESQPLPAPQSPSAAPASRRKLRLVRRGSPRPPARLSASPDSAPSSAPERSSRSRVRAACASLHWAAPAARCHRIESTPPPAPPHRASARIASAVTDFPEPDSPTSPSTSPAEIERLKSETTRRSIPRERNQMERPLISRREDIGKV